MFIIYNPWLFRLMHQPPMGMALYPFVLLRRRSDRNNLRLLNHEKIHLRQQIELLILPFYVLYVAHYLYNRIFRNKNHYEAYYDIFFEREAFEKEDDFDYLKKREIWASFAYLKRKNFEKTRKK
ncbi:hypothetical protein [Hugenholtzia roseola]|uniref:hypothetical protein n=1 Tax=Hugenholtzia roseola TaxID=1002 RepID=UPI0003F79C3C|nr:hypothetical protein [Hugenholtzia roseola]